MDRFQWKRLVPVVLVAMAVLFTLGACAGEEPPSNPDPPPDNTGIVEPDPDPDNESICEADYELGRTQYRYVFRPGDGGQHKYTLVCGPKGDEAPANDIEVTPDSNLRLANEFGEAIKIKVSVPSTKTLFGFRAAHFYVAKDSWIDLRVQHNAHLTLASPYTISVQAAPNLTDTTWVEKSGGSPDPALHVKGGG